VSLLEQILQIPYAFAWLPALVFFVVVGGIYWMSRPMPEYVDAPAGTAPAQPAAEPKKKNQRESSRRLGNTVEVHVGSPDNKKDPGIGSVLDRSMGGIRLALYHKVEVGAILSVHPVHADNMVPWVDLEVRSCKPSAEMSDLFEVGCQYVKSPPYSIQLLFG
jgi:hypothetical protein